MLDDGKWTREEIVDEVISVLRHRLSLVSETSSYGSTDGSVTTTIKLMLDGEEISSVDLDA